MGKTQPDNETREPRQLEDAGGTAPAVVIEVACAADVLAAFAVVEAQLKPTLRYLAEN